MMLHSCQPGCGQKPSPQRAYNGPIFMPCPLCSERKAKRSCPALGHRICAVCCATKRLTEIRCPSDCPYLATARDHPASITRRQQERDLALLVHAMRDLNDRQARLLLAVNSQVVGYRPPDLHSLADSDVAEAAAALAATFETAARGVIYDHRPSSRPAERLAGALRPLLDDLGKNGGTPFDRDAAVVLRRIEETVRQLGASATEPNPYLGMLGRIARARDDSAATPAGAAPAESRLIVP